MHYGLALPAHGFVQCSSCLSLERLLRAVGGREESWELCGTQAHTPLVAGSGDSKVASEVPEEAQALLVLRHWQETPGLGIQLVPEHVETQPLYHRRSPGLLQLKEGSAPNPGTPGLPPGPGPGPPGCPFSKTSTWALPLLTLAPDPGPQNPHSSLGLPSWTPYPHPGLWF